MRGKQEGRGGEEATTTWARAFLAFACLDLERSRTRSKGRLDKKKPSPCALVALEFKWR